jgi:hypothetical protein
MPEIERQTQRPTRIDSRVGQHKTIPKEKISVISVTLKAKKTNNKCIHVSCNLN